MSAKVGFKIEIVNKSLEVYNKLNKLGFCFNNGSKEREKLRTKLEAHIGYVFGYDTSAYVGSNLDYAHEPTYYEKYTKFTITEDELLMYLRFKNAKYKDDGNRIRLIEDLWKTYQKREEAEAIRTLIKAL